MKILKKKERKPEDHADIGGFLGKSLLSNLTVILLTLLHGCFRTSLTCSDCRIIEHIAGHEVAIPSFPGEALNSWK